MVVHAAEIGLRRRVTLFGGLAVPVQRFGIALREANALIVHHAEIILRIEVALLGGLAKPFCGLGRIPRGALTGVVHYPEIVLGIGIALLGQRAPQPHGGGVVAVFGRGNGILQRACGDGYGNVQHQQDRGDGAAQCHFHGL